MQPRSRLLGPHGTSQLQGRCLRLLHRQRRAENHHRLGAANSAHSVIRLRARPAGPKREIILMLSSIICIISIVRLWIMSTQLFGTDSTDFTWLFNDSSTGTAVETNIGIVSGMFSSQPCALTGVSSSSLLNHDRLVACLPSLRPVLTACLGRWSKQAKGASIQVGRPTATRRSSYCRLST